ncbi:hypothetical protein [Pseudomonas kuykendallii]|uniref:hypothetical protein n=1 Tax=Pseudomonas kuykendallii TaxID=1007099 RepID=UPI0028D31DF0|nr:hypothetical protein [Pseudomonas kuykendallii]
MQSTYWIGQAGLPVILRGMTAAEVRTALQPQTPREEFLLAMLEETHERLIASIALQDDFDETDDGESIRIKVSLAERAEHAERKVRNAQESKETIRRLVRELLLDQGMVASESARLEMVLQQLKKIDTAMHAWHQQLA